MTKHPDIAEESFRIDSALRNVFLGIGNVVQGELNAAECERVYQDSLNDRVARKDYSFYKSLPWIVTGLVMENKPYWIRIKIIWMLKEPPIAFGDILLTMAHAARMSGVLKHAEYRAFKTASPETLRLITFAFSL